MATLKYRNSGFSTVLTHLTKSHQALSEGYLAKEVPPDHCTAFLLCLQGPSQCDSFHLEPKMTK